MDSALKVSVELSILRAVPSIAGPHSARGRGAVGLCYDESKLAASSADDNRCSERLFGAVGRRGRPVALWHIHGFNVSPPDSLTADLMTLDARIARRGAARGGFRL